MLPLHDAPACAGCLLSEPEVDIIDQVIGGVFEDREDYIGISIIEGSIGVLGDRNEVKLFDSPNGETCFREVNGMPGRFCIRRSFLNLVLDVSIEEFEIGANERISHLLNNTDVFLTFVL